MKANGWISLLGALSSLTPLAIGFLAVSIPEVGMVNPSLQEMAMTSGDIGTVLLCAAGTVVNGTISMIALSRSGLVGDS